MASHKKRMSGANSKRSNLPNGPSKSDCHQGNAKAQIGALSHGQGSAKDSQATFRKEQKSRGQSSSIRDSTHSAGFDAARITQWAENSATGFDTPDFRGYSQICSTFPDDPSLTALASALPGTFFTSDPNASSLQPHFFQPYGQDMESFPSSTASPEAHFARMDISHDLPPSQAFDCSVNYQDDQFAFGLSSQGNLPFEALPNANDLSYDSMRMRPAMAMSSPNDFTLPSEWDYELVTAFSGANTMRVAPSVDWSSPTALTPSTSSLQSEYMDPQLETSISATMQDFNWATAQAVPMVNEMEMLPPSGFEESVHVHFDNSYMDSESTLRPKQAFQRAPLARDLWATQDTAGQAFGLPQYHGLPVSRRSSEGENKTARDHPFYKAEPSKEDGLYHCPDPNKDGCAKAEKLKCNYDKHLDSHLKPYRCKSQGCAQAVFSSTACLLRHEREAHSMHGHGNKPHLCHFQDCERAAEDNGFPRRWNLFDHMKRVHDYDPSNKSNSPSPSSSSPPPQDAPRKRRTPSPTQEGAKKRTRISSPQTIHPSAAVKPPVQSQQLPRPQAWSGMSLEQIRSGHVTQMEVRIRTMDATGPSAREQNRKDFEMLQMKLAAQMARNKESRL